MKDEDLLVALRAMPTTAQVALVGAVISGVASLLLLAALYFLS